MSVNRSEPTFRLRSEWLRALEAPPVPPPLVKKVLRTFLLSTVGFLIGLPAFLIVTRALPTTSTAGRWLYSFHDEVLLRIWGYLWRQHYPWSLAFWGSVAVITATTLWVWLSDQPVTRRAHVALQKWVMRSPKLWPLALVLIKFLEQLHRKGRRLFTHGQLRAVAEVEWQQALATVIRSPRRAPLEETKRFVQLLKVRLDLMVVCPRHAPEYFPAAALWHTAALHLESGAAAERELGFDLLPRGVRLGEALLRETEPTDRPPPFSRVQLARDFAACIAGRVETASDGHEARIKTLYAAVARRLSALDQILRQMGGSRFRVVRSSSDLWSILSPEDAIAAPLAVTTALEVSDRVADAETAWRTMELMNAVLLAARLQQRTAAPPVGVSALVDAWVGQAPSPWHRRMASDRMDQAARERWHVPDYVAETKFSPWHRARQRLAFARTQAGVRMPPPHLEP